MAARFLFPHCPGTGLWQPRRDAAECFLLGSCGARPQSPAARKPLNVSYAYFAVVLAAASALPRHNGAFYPGVTLLDSGRAGRRAPAPRFLAGVDCPGGNGARSPARQPSGTEIHAGGPGGQLGRVDRRLFRQSPDSRECRTLIGHTRTIKNSGAIVLRVHVPPGVNPPSLLREASYNIYKRETWWAASNDFSSASPSATNDSSFRLLPPKNAAAVVQIARYFPDGAGILAMPHGTFEIDDLPANLHTNRLGVATIDSGPGLLNLTACYGGGASLDAPPGPLDVLVPDNERPVLDDLTNKLGLNAMSEPQKIRAVSRFFRDSFHYSLRGDQGTNNTPLARFLTQTRAGHCEYFATATVLLLREAGVNARYVTGYMVPDSARHGDTYLVRQRHAHAWALVFHSDPKRWEQIDNTPSSGDETEESHPPWWEKTADLLSNLYFDFSMWRWRKTSLAYYAAWLIGPLILYLAWRIFSTRRRHSRRAGRARRRRTACLARPGFRTLPHQPPLVPKSSFRANPANRWPFGSSASNRPFPRPRTCAGFSSCTAACASTRAAWKARIAPCSNARPRPGWRNSSPMPASAPILSDLLGSATVPVAPVGVPADGTSAQ